MKFSRFFVYMVFVIVGVILAGSWLVSRTAQEAAFIDVTDQPTIGDPLAKVHLVVFEEPKCAHCRNYNNTIFPLIKEEFIDTHKIIYTVIPVSFLPRSMLGANALLCVYNQDPGYPNADLFIKFLDNLFKNDWSSIEDVFHIAEITSPAINKDRLQQCVTKAVYEDQIHENLKLGKELQKEQFSVPSLYIDGNRVSEVNFDAIKEAILKRLNETKGP